MKRMYVVTVRLMVEGSEKNEHESISKSVKGLLCDLIDNDEPPHNVVDFEVVHVADALVIAAGGGG